MVINPVFCSSIQSYLKQQNQLVPPESRISATLSTPAIIVDLSLPAVIKNRAEQPFTYSNTCLTRTELNDRI